MLRIYSVEAGLTLSDILSFLPHLFGIFCRDRHQPIPNTSHTIKYEKQNF
jgi:hypothetical protein